VASLFHERESYLVYEDLRKNALYFVDTFIRSLFSKPNSECVARGWYASRKELDYDQIPHKEMTAIFETMFKTKEPLLYASEVFIIRGKNSDVAERYLHERALRTNVLLITCRYEELGYPLYVELFRKSGTSVERKKSPSLLSPSDKKSELKILAKTLIGRLTNSILIIQSEELLPDDISFFEAFFHALREASDKNLLIFWITSHEETMGFLIKHRGVVIGSTKSGDKVKTLIEKKDFDLFKLLVVYRRPCPVITLYQLIQKPDFIPRLFFYAADGILFFSEEGERMCIGIRDYTYCMSNIPFGKHEKAKIHKAIARTFEKESSLGERIEFLGHLHEARRAKEAFLYFREIVEDLKALRNAEHLLLFGNIFNSTVLHRPADMLASEGILRFTSLKTFEKLRKCEYFMPLYFLCFN
jgi:hypothetical protein